MFTEEFLLEFLLKRFIVNYGVNGAAGPRFGVLKIGVFNKSILRASNDPRLNAPCPICPKFYFKRV